MVQVMNPLGGASSDLVVVSVIAPVQIVQQPLSQSITNGQRVTLMVGAMGGQALLYQWFAGDSGDTNNPIAGAVFNTYSTAPLTATARYWVLVSSVGSRVASQTAVLSLPDVPTTLAGVSLAGGKLNLRITGSPGTRWALQTSSDLVNWAPDARWGTVLLGVSGSTNLQAQPEGSRPTFFRAQLLP